MAESVTAAASVPAGGQILVKGARQTTATNSKKTARPTNEKRLAKPIAIGGEASRTNRTQEVGGSSPPSSITKGPLSRAFVF
jgi:hypothetical protein